MSVGRYFCVALPFILTVLSIICMLIAGLTGVVNNGLYLFRVDVTNLSIDPNTFADIVNGIDDASEAVNRLGARQTSLTDWADSEIIDNVVEGATGSVSSASDIIDSFQNDDLDTISAAELGLGKVYDVNLWGFCATWQDDSHNCTGAQFDWAQHHLNTEVISRFNGLAELDITVPTQLQQGLDAFITVSRWTQIVYIIAMISLGLELIVGLFTACSRGVSCVTWLISGVATFATIAAAAMMSAMGGVVLGAVEASLSQHGATASMNRQFLAAVWIGAAAAAGASLFWLFSVCCCKPEKRPYKNGKKGGKHSDDTEKFLPTGSYQPIGDHHQQQSGFNLGGPRRGGARSDLAYEPYSHSR
jgi:hypothetical protein